MVKPPLRTKSIGFKVSEEEYAQLETVGRTLGEWCREMILRGGSASRLSLRKLSLQNLRGQECPRHTVCGAILGRLFWWLL
jgi:hypothetical protein